MAVAESNTFIVEPTTGISDVSPKFTLINNNKSESNMPYNFITINGRMYNKNYSNKFFNIQKYINQKYILKLK
jgi:hypothetical protein